MSDPVRVVVADDNPIVRAGLASLLELEDDIEVCGEASSGPEACDLVGTHRPDVVLLDVRMPDGGGLEVLAEIAAVSRVLMLTHSDEPSIVSRALRFGATGFLVHGAFETSELAMAIRDTAHGRVRLSPSAAAVLLQALRPDPGSDSNPEPHAGTRVSPEIARTFRLSRRELEIADLMVRGHTNTEIAGELFIEEKTVKNHINRLFAKLATSNRAVAVTVLLGTHENARPVVPSRR